MSKPMKRRPPKTSKERLTDIRHFAEMVKEQAIGGEKTAREMRRQDRAVHKAYAVVEQNEAQVECELARLRKLAGLIADECRAPVNVYLAISRIANIANEVSNG